MIRLGLALAILLLSSCVPAAFRPARTIPKGEVEHSIGASLIEFPTVGCGKGCVDDSLRIERVPNVGYALRYGLAETLDVGFGYSAPAALSADATIQVVRRGFFDLSLAPMVAYEFVTGVPSFAAPVIVDLNLHEVLSVVGMAGPLVVHGYGNDGREAIWMGQAAAGLEFRPSPKVSLRPYAGILRSFGEGETLPIFGLGVGLGAQRDFR